MPPNKDNCPECGRSHAVCPDCGEAAVSVDAVTPDWGSLTPDFNDFAVYGETGEELEYKIVCWECGFEENRTVKIVEGLQPCDNYHPLPCGLDEDCPVPSDFFNADMSSREIYEEWIEDHDEE